LLESLKRRGARVLLKPFHLSDLVALLVEVLEPVSIKSR
jgi:hypothetical protein